LPDALALLSLAAVDPAAFLVVNVYQRSRKLHIVRASHQVGEAVFAEALVDHRGDHGRAIAAEHFHADARDTRLACILDAVAVQSFQTKSPIVAGW